ncbi:unnamed protein product [Lupinus luteus]|uniref:Uncharacterized protein n=1 Tax=Lupinus luteus TaxID=3873 RepID=A0AAV1XPC3_LUPLU
MVGRFLSLNPAIGLAPSDIRSMVRSLVICLTHASEVRGLFQPPHVDVMLSNPCAPTREASLAARVMRPVSFGRYWDSFCWHRALIFLLSGMASCFIFSCPYWSLSASA